MQTHWRNLNAVAEDARAHVEARLSQLSARHTDLIDIRLSAKPSRHHRHGGQEVSIVAQARGRELVASRTRPDLERALQAALDAFEREVWKMRDIRARGAHLRQRIGSAELLESAPASETDLDHSTPIHRPEHPTLVAVGGLVASGKSSIAREAARLLGAEHVEADQVRDEILHIESGQTAHEAAWLDNLAPGVTARVYSEMLDRAREGLLSGNSVIIDGCFALRSQRAGARSLAHECNTDFLFVECRTSRSELEQRLSARSLAAGIPDSAWLTLLNRVERRWEPVTEFSADENMWIDSARPLASTVDDVVANLCCPYPIAASGGGP
jgi:predicted kinase/ribosome-associated translation inhibitor RaiA